MWSFLAKSGEKDTTKNPNDVRKMLRKEFVVLHGLLCSDTRLVWGS